MILLFSAAALYPTLAQAQNFDAVFDLVQQMRQGQRFDVDIQVKADTFTILREQETPLNKDTFEALRASADKKGWPHLKYLRDTEAFVFPVNATLEIEEQKHGGAAGTTTWLKREYVPVATYNVALWSNFLREALKHGLTAINQSATDSTITSLDFAPYGPDHIPYGTKSLALPPKFYQYMKLSPQHAPFTGSNGFVVLVHDPHASRTGRFELLPGLRALLSANRSPVIFLDEGEFKGQTRTIGFNTLDQIMLPAERARVLQPVVYNLLGRYLIDSAMAYRLLYDRNLPALAIDETQFLPTIALGQRPDSLMKVNRALVNILKALDGLKDKIPAEDLNRATQLVIYATIYEQTEIEDLDGRTLVKHFDNLADTLSDIVTLARLIKQVNPASQVDLDADFLQRQAAAYRGESKEYGLALNRDKPMATRIAEQAHTAETRLPVAFIGSFHTDGITSYLRSLKIGYVVVEPRHNYTFSDQEQQAFDSYLYQDQRPAYLRSATSQNKGPVVPTVVEVQRYYQPFVRREATRVMQRDQDAAHNYQQLPGKELDYPAFNEALKANGVLSNARVEFGGPTSLAIPPDAGSPFAFFEPGDNGSGRFMVLNAGDTGWSTQRGRYSCLREIKLLPPLVREDLSPHRQVSFYEDADSKTIYSSLFEPQSRRYYLYEGDKALDMLSTMVLSKPSKDRDMLIRMRLAELEHRLQRRIARANTGVRASGE
jgi:hypothetical protein